MVSVTLLWDRSPDPKLDQNRQAHELGSRTYPVAVTVGRAFFRRDERERDKKENHQRIFWRATLFPVVPNKSQDLIARKNNTAEKSFRRA
ncbi:hypothetical protein CEXT_314201 [Caerostris extrusa]|uniref:Uncharacterized protein n=1 Tax=Caerostris extrusa TaxID=172846 RepID=A0AAV4W229_CAEEX|nr:hypothetical protein CEXT_314201 [Caerostris extrusa]